MTSRRQRVAIITGSDHERAMGAATPVGRSGTADEVAYAIAFLAGEGASYITGQLITVDGANSTSEEHGREGRYRQ
ncbi:SDR family oxidoreductase [Georgenia sp. Z1491]|uniref:SDR family oxidoreductase n=1 Tax=Georgenia sp. Z1491 TaxID=3416707 RepID=UPI003CE8C6B2